MYKSFSHRIYRLNSRVGYLVLAVNQSRRKITPNQYGENLANPLPHKNPLAMETTLITSSILRLWPYATYTVRNTPPLSFYSKTLLMRLNYIYNQGIISVMKTLISGR